MWQALQCAAKKYPLKFFAIFFFSRKNSKWLLGKWQTTLGDTFFAAHCISANHCQCRCSKAPNSTQLFTPDFQVPLSNGCKYEFILGWDWIGCASVNDNLPLPVLIPKYASKLFLSGPLQDQLTAFPKLINRLPNFTTGHSQAILSKLLTYCVLRSTQPPTLSRTENQ